MIALLFQLLWPVPPTVPGVEMILPANYQGATTCVGKIPVTVVRGELDPQTLADVRVHEGVHRRQAIRGEGCQANLLRYRTEPRYRVLSEAEAYCGGLASSMAVMDSAQKVQVRQNLVHTLLIAYNVAPWNIPQKGPLATDEETIAAVEHYCR